VRARFARPNQQDFHEATGRIDRSFSQQDRLTGPYFYDRFQRNAVFDPGNFLTYLPAPDLMATARIDSNRLFCPPARDHDE
jgi:hypothetical protein